MHRKFSLLFIILVLFNCKEESKELSETSLNPIEYLMVNNTNFVLEYPEINSVSIGVYKDGKTYTGYYGEIDKGKNNLPNDHSIFELASVTKTFTGIITAQAVLDGKLNLDDDIRNYLDDSYPNLEYKNRSIQIRDLLTHSSGIRRDFSEALLKMFSLNSSPEDKKNIVAYDREALLKDLKQYKLDTIPGTRYDYSPVIGPEILAIILEKVYHKSYSELLKEQILTKAKMNQTSLTLSPSEADFFLNGYDDEGQLVEPIVFPMTGAGAGLKSTIPDVLKYIEYLLETNNPVVKEMKKPLFTDEEEGMFGYFWQVNTDGEFMHNGGTNGSTNWVVILPKLNAGFTVMFNSNGDTSGMLINSIANRILDDIEIYPKKNIYFLIKDKIIHNTDEGIAFYKKVKREKSEDYNFQDASILNRIGYELLRKEQKENAIKVFKLLVSEFPDQGNPYDSLGEAYFLNEQYDLSLKNYKIALELNPENSNAKDMIEEINKIN
ncbi:serine hydrolase [Psychroserpens mesophilus]|uniref:serine hydrolase n=1 Tax=Psychroserpens mesophilus TaxID=325473 RepID=UPI003D660462